jgi:hypothetical protein
MDDQVLIETRRGLHAVAELVLAGPQYRAARTIRLRITPGGFGQVKGPLRVEVAELVGEHGRVPLRGGIAALAAAAGVEAGAPEGLYSDHAELTPADVIDVDPAAAAELADWLDRGDQALRALAPDVEPVLWPEHFDLGSQLDEVNYGISPGDAGHPRPYAYVGPWTPRSGPFWNAPFGARRAADELPDVAAVTAFFAEGRAAAAAAG